MKTQASKIVNGVAETLYEEGKRIKKIYGIDSVEWSRHAFNVCAIAEAIREAAPKNNEFIYQIHHMNDLARKS